MGLEDITQGKCVDNEEEMKTDRTLSFPNITRWAPSFAITALDLDGPDKVTAPGFCCPWATLVTEAKATALGPTAKEDPAATQHL